MTFIRKIALEYYEKLPKRCRGEEDKGWGFWEGTTVPGVAGVLGGSNNELVSFAP